LLFVLCFFPASASTPIVSVVIAVVATLTVEVKHVEQIADGRHVARNVGVTIIVFRIGQIVAAAVTERGTKLPVPFNEFHKRGMLVIDVADMASGGEGRNRDHGNARTGAKKIHWLDEA